MINYLIKFKIKKIIIKLNNKLILIIMMKLVYFLSKLEIKLNFIVDLCK